MVKNIFFVFRHISIHFEKSFFRIYLLRAASRAPEGASEFCFRKYFLWKFRRVAGLRRGRPVKRMEWVFQQFEEHGLTILIQKCDWNKLTSFSQLPDCSSPDFCKKMNFNSFHQEGVWKNQEVCIFKFLKLQSVQIPSILSKDVFE